MHRPHKTFVHMKKLSSLVALGLLIATTSAQNNVCFTVGSNPNSSDPALSSFTKYVDVFGCSVYAESTVPDEKVLHAAAIWAELIDNDEDGIVDDPALLAELVANEAMMPVFAADGNAAMTSVLKIIIMEWSCCCTLANRNESKYSGLLGLRRNS